MKFKQYILPIAALTLMGLSTLTACSDWTDEENITLQQPGIDEQNPEAYAHYLSNLRAYKTAPHKIVYGWFDNSQKTPSSRAHHFADVPDSLDVVVVSTPQLADFELQDKEQLANKGTRLFFNISYDNLLKAHTAAAKEGSETRDFATYLSDQLSSLLAAEVPFDGLVAEYRGSSPIYMSEAEKTAAKQLQDAFFGAIGTWKQAHADKHLTFAGYPANLISQSLLAEVDHIILPTQGATDEEQLGIEAMQALIAQGVPSDRFLFAASTVSMDATDKTTGFYGERRALSEAAYWMTEPCTAYTRAGLSVLQIQNDYYNATCTYQYLREAIQIMNPAPVK